MRKLITIVLALLIALSPVLAHAESMNLAALLADKSNQNLGNENGVYNALYKILVKANGKDFPLREIMLASTCMSKIATGEAFSPEETVFDESLSAYEKYFLLTLTNATLTDEEADDLTAIFDGNVKAFPADGKALYVADKDIIVAEEAGKDAEETTAEKTEKEEKDAFITGLMRQAMEKMGYQYVPETINEALTLYTIKDKDDAVVLSAREVLTSLPHAILMKHVPEEKKQESAAALARVEAAIPDTIDWVKLAKGDDEANFDDLDNLDDFLEDSDEEDDEEGESEGASESKEEEKVELTEEQIAELTEKWLKLFFACDAYDLQPDEATFKAVTEALLDMCEEKPEITFEPEAGISLKFAEAAPEATPAPASSSSGGSGGTKTPAKELVNLEPPYNAYTGQYIIYVSKNSCTITIVGRGSDNRWTKKIKSFPTSIGKAGQTRSGLFWVSKKERWHSWSGSSYSPYSVKQSGGSYIHGPMYTAKDSNKMVASSYNAIGTKSSAGCLGTVCAAAGYIYYNCPIGTMVIIADDSRFKASKPKKIPDDQTYDPTESKIERKGDPNASIAAATIAPTETAAPAETTNNSSSSSGGTTSSGGSSDNKTDTTVQDNAIRELQSLLVMNNRAIDLGTDPQQPQKGESTKAAILAFQQAYNTTNPTAKIREDGENDEATMAALRSSGMETVKKVQESLGLTASGSYDSATINAVKKFQETKGLPTTGVTDNDTLNALGIVFPPATPDQNQDVALTSFTVTPDTLALEVGDTTNLTINKQPENATSTFNYATSDSGIATIDTNGKVTAKAAGQATITVTSSVSSVSPVQVTVTVTESSFKPISSSSSESDVKEVQHLLVILGYLSENKKVNASAVDGVYGPGTTAAVKEFQKKNVLPEADEVDKATYQALKQEAKSTIRSIQDKLLTYGSLAGDTSSTKLTEDDFDSEKETPEVKGVYGSKTIRAVAAFQIAFNIGKGDDAKLNTKGIADEATREALDAEVQRLQDAENTSTDENAGASETPSEQTSDTTPSDTTPSDANVDQKPAEPAKDSDNGTDTSTDSDKNKEDVEPAAENPEASGEEPSTETGDTSSQDSDSATPTEPIEAHDNKPEAESTVESVEATVAAKEVPAETPVETPAETPVETPAETSTESIETAPAESSADVVEEAAPVEAPSAE